MFITANMYNVQTNAGQLPVPHIHARSRSCRAESRSAQEEVNGLVRSANLTLSLLICFISLNI